MSKGNSRKLSPHDLEKDFESEEAIENLLAEAFSTQDVAHISHAIGLVARAKGMAQIANETGLSREQLYRSLSVQGNPTLKTTLAVMRVLGVKLTAETASFISKAPPPSSPLL